MSSVVHFKFRSSLKFDSIRFNGHEISIRELKEEIVKAKKLDKFMEDYDLMITNDQTKKEYKADEYVPKNSSVIVARFPITKSRRDLQKKATSSPVQTSETDSTLDCITKMTDVASMNLSEEDKLITVMDQGNREFDNVNYSKLKKLPKGPVPKNYVCHRCGMPGHFIQKCPRPRDVNAADSFPKLKRSTGIPISFMKHVDDPNTPGVLLTSCGKLAVPIIDAEAYRIGKKEKPPFLETTEVEKEEKVVIPKELICPVCGDLLTDAVVLPCCGDSACDSCVTTELLHSSVPKCPVCKKMGLSPLDVIPNKSTRTAVFNYKNETGYSSMSKKDNVLTQQQQQQPEAQAKVEPMSEEKPVVSMHMKAEDIKEEPLHHYNSTDIKESLPATSETRLPEEKPRLETHELVSTAGHYPMGDPVPIPGIKGAKMVRVLVARPGAPAPGDQPAPSSAYSQMSTVNMYSLPPPPLPHNYHAIIAQPRMIQHGANPMPINQARNSHVLIYPGGLPPSRVIGPPPSLVPIGASAPMPMAFPPRMPSAMPLTMPMPGVAPVPMTEEEFYREKERLREMERKRHHVGGSMSPFSPKRDSRLARRKDVFEFAEDIMYKKAPRTRKRSRSRSFMRSFSTSRSRSRGRHHRSRSRTNKYKSSHSPMRRSRSPFRKSRSPDKKSRSSIRRSCSPARKSHSSLARSPSQTRKSCSPAGKLHNKSSSQRKDLYTKSYRDSPGRSMTPKRSRERRSPSFRHSGSINKFHRSRSISSHRSYVKANSRSRSPLNTNWTKGGHGPLDHGLNKMSSKARTHASNRSLPLKRQKELTDFGEPVYERVRRSRTPSRHRHFPHPEGYSDRMYPEEVSYRSFKGWHGKRDSDRRDAQRMMTREEDFSGSPFKKRGRPYSGDSHSLSMERSPSFKGQRREPKESWKEPLRFYNRERYEKVDMRDQKLSGGTFRQEAKEYHYKEKDYSDRDYNSRYKEASRLNDKDAFIGSSTREESIKKPRTSEDRQISRDEKISRMHPSKEVHKADFPIGKDSQSSKSLNIKSPPPKSKVQIIGPKETRVKEACGPSVEQSLQPQETSVRIVTKDTCKTMKITVSSKWDSEKEHERRSDKEKSSKAEEAADKSLSEDCEKSSKHKKKHKKEKKKHKKHKSKGPE